MLIKKLKEFKQLKKNDVALVTVVDQQDAGVFSDITDPNMLIVVDRVTELEGDTVMILCAGGYEFEYNSTDICFYMGNLSEALELAEDLVELHEEGNSVKNINKDLKSYLEFRKFSKEVEKENKK